MPCLAPFEPKIKERKINQISKVKDKNTKININTKHKQKQGISKFANPRQRRQKFDGIVKPHKFNPLFENCSIGVSRVSF